MVKSRAGFCFCRMAVPNRNAARSLCFENGHGNFANISSGNSQAAHAAGVRMADPAVAVELGFGAIKVRFGGALHMRIDRERLLGVHSWRNGDRKFTIEYTLVGGVVLGEYDEEAKWKAILDGLDKILP